MDWSETHYIFQEPFPVERTLFFPFKIEYRESYSHNRCAVFAADDNSKIGWPESYCHNRCAVFATDDNSSDSYGLGYPGHVFDDD